MRLTTVILIASLMQVSAAGFAQKISLSKSNASLKGVIKELKQQSGYNFVYAEYLLKDAKPVNIDVKDMEFKDVLEQLLDNQPLSYSMDSKTVILRRKEIPSLLSKVKEALGIPIVVTGRVTDSTGRALPGASIKIKDKVIRADSEGRFSFSAEPGTEVTVSFVGYQSYSFKTTPDVGFQNVVLKAITGKLEEVVVSTGYQQLPKERATGSFDFIDNKLLNRLVSTDILSRLDGVTPGVLFNNVNRTGGNDPKISVRGRSTLFANTDPLIVVDNFPYDGDINNINPNDVESISILKDAAAASIWGTRAGNGVIVITTKKGRYNQKPQISFNSNVTISGKPNLYDVPQMTSAQFIELQKYLFSKGSYNLALNYLPKNPQTQVVDILDKRQKGLISSQDSAALIGALAQNDIRKDQSKYLYRSSVKQQYNLGIDGGGENHQYYFSVGYDNNISSSIPNGDNRTTLKAKNTIQLFNKKLEIKSDLQFSNSNSKQGAVQFAPTAPYDRLADENGNHLPIYQQYRKAFIDTAGSGNLLNWTNVPLDELKDIPIQIKTNEYKADFDVNYKIRKTLNVIASYQYTKGYSQQIQDRDQNSYYVRDLINQYSNINYSTGEVIRPIPLGGIRKQFDADYSINYGRAQLNYNEQIGKGFISVIGGFEIRNYNSDNSNFTQYGYDSATRTSLNVNTTSMFPSFVNGQSRTINALPETAFSTDNSISYYANASYTYNGKYSISGSARRDESNLFGVKTNQKGVPLWSTGISWNLSDENWFKSIEKFPNVKLRATTGYNGNLIKSLSAFTTANVSSDLNYPFQIPFATIINPPNPSLAWEKVHITNLALDVSTKNGRISGTLEFFNKKGTDLIGTAPIAPQTGVTQFTGNNAAVITKGLEASITTLNLDGNFKWKTLAIVNYVADRVITNQNPLPFNSLYIDGNYQSPMEDKPYSAIFAYPTGSLDNKGNPQGYLNGNLSENYTGILNSTNINDLKYIGPANPTVFGSLLNSFSYKEVDISFNIGYKGGYYFRRGSFTANPNNYKMPDYENRWQKSGDENTTYVPSIIYPLNGNRDAVYTGSDKLVLKGDHIRLRDIQLSYTIHSNLFNNLGLTTLKIYSYVTNINLILWRANNLKLDPDYMGYGGTYNVKTPCTFSFGLQCNLK